MDSRRRRLRRVVTRVIVFLMLGAAVNVAVAWGLAARTEPPHVVGLGIYRFDSGSYRSDTGDWFVRVSTCFGSEYFESHPFHRGDLGPNLRGHDARAVYPAWADRYAEPDDGTNFLPQFHMIGHAAGWPCWAMCAYEDHGEPASERSIISWGYQLGDKESPSRIPRLMTRCVLPLRPLWPGFAINALFYAAILWLLLAAPFALRRRLRLRFGRCPDCAYPVGASDLCTECGKPVTPRAS
jgi:hypothetical protein